MFYQVRAAPSHYAKFSKSSGGAKLWGFSAAGSSDTQRTKGQSGHRIAADSSQKDINSKGHSGKSHTSTVTAPPHATPGASADPAYTAGYWQIKEEKAGGISLPNNAKQQLRPQQIWGKPPAPHRTRKQPAARSRRIRPCRRHPGARCQAGAAGGHPLRSCRPAGLPAYHTPTPPGKA